MLYPSTLRAAYLFDGSDSWLQLRDAQALRIVAAREAAGEEMPLEATAAMCAPYMCFRHQDWIEECTLNIGADGK